MNKSISIILAHPNPQSFNHAIALQAKSTIEEMGKKWLAEVSDLIKSTA